MSARRGSPRGGSPRPGIALDGVPCRYCGSAAHVATTLVLERRSRPRWLWIVCERCASSQEVLVRDVEGGR
jgi:hypothetical protein